MATSVSTTPIDQSQDPANERGPKPVIGAQSTARAKTARGEILALSFGLGMLLIAAKFVLLPFPVETTGEFFRWALRLALVCAADVCFVASVCVVALLRTRLLARF